MNPLTNIRNQNEINKRELEFGIAGGSAKSWHSKYAQSAWIYVGGLPFELNEGDIIAVFSQYGEIVNMNLVRHQKTGQSRGFAFICYEDQRSTILAVDNLNGIKLLKRTIRVDHVEEYRVPKYKEQLDEETKRLLEEGCAPKPIIITQADENNGNEEDDSSANYRGRRRKFNKDGVIELNEELAKKLKKEEKKAKKEQKRLKKESRKKAGNERASTDDIKDRSGFDDSSWKEHKHNIDTLPLNDDDFYTSNEHFKFGKPKKEAQEVQRPVHNPRPDFEKADWRDIEMWKAIREKEKQEKGGNDDDDDDEAAQTTARQEEYYLPSRFHH